MLDPSVPAVILAPMEGLTDAPMRTVQGEIGTFSFAVAEFLRISQEVPPKSVFHRQVPELLNHARTPSGLQVQVQLLGGHPERMALSALVACQAGATAIDINFGCPSPTVNGNDGGATLLKHPRRIREIVRAVRDAVPQPVPVSAKLRLGWDSVDAIHENAAMAAEGGASWVTIHGRTREQGYRPPAAWEPIGTVREHLGIPVVANGDIWSLDQFRRCRETTGCTHFMLGRGALANPFLSRQVAGELGLFGEESAHENAEGDTVSDWRPYLQRLVRVMAASPGRTPVHTVRRLKQWLRIASLQGDFSAFDAIKRADSVEEIFTILGSPVPAPKL